jgi:hypothetical protein
VVDYYLPRGLPPPAEIRATATDGLRLHVRRLIELRESLPPVPRPARFATFARHRSKPAPDFPHRLVWLKTGARCSECYKLFRAKKGWSSECTGAPGAIMSAFRMQKASVCDGWAGRWAACSVPPMRLLLTVPLLQVRYDLFCQSRHSRRFFATAACV